MNSGLCTTTTAQKKKFSIKDFFSKCNKICRRLCIYLHLLKKSLMENFIFCIVNWNMVLILAVIGNMKPCGSLKKEHTFSTFLLVSFEAFPKHMKDSNWIKIPPFFIFQSTPKTPLVGQKCTSEKVISSFFNDSLLLHSWESK